MTRRYFWSVFAFILFCGIMAVVAIKNNFGTQQKETMREVILEDGTRCVVLSTENKITIDCDWRKNEPNKPN